MTWQVAVAIACSLIIKTITLFPVLLLCIKFNLIMHFCFKEFEKMLEELRMIN